MTTVLNIETFDNWIDALKDIREKDSGTNSRNSGNMGKGFQKCRFMKVKVTEFI